MKNRGTKNFFYVLSIAAIVLIGAAVYREISTSPPLIFSEKAMLNALWERYKNQYIENGTNRTLDRSRNNVTTSEGQGYTMLRAVWMDDHPAFDASWTWLKNNMQTKGGVYSWLYGKRNDGSYGILNDQGGQNSASDADTDIATALAFAYARWRDPAYLEAAKSTINGIWNNEVIMIHGKPYLAANNVEKNYKTDFISNPSYFAPYAYRIFADIDPSHDWNGLIDTSYSLLSQSMSSNLGGAGTASIPPDWITVSRADGSIKNPQSRGLDSNFGFDALRIPWRVYLDWQWYGEPRAKDILSKMSFLSDQWNSARLINSVYSHSGDVIEQAEFPAMYGGTMAYFSATSSTTAKDFYDSKLLPLYSPDSNSWKKDLSYYDDNWAWFGMALYNNELPNLWKTVN